MIPLEPGKKRSTRSIWQVAILVFGLIVIVGIFLPAVSTDESGPNRRANCLSNIKQLLMAVAMYADSSGGRCPMDSVHPTLVGSMQLLSNVATTAKILYCPSDHRPGAHPETDFKKLTTLNISYSYVPNLIWQINLTRSCSWIGYTRQRRAAPGPQTGITNRMAVTLVIMTATSRGTILCPPRSRTRTAKRSC